MRKILLRHSVADYESAFKSGALPPEGIELARSAGRSVAEMLNGEKVHRVTSSPMLRALATAEHVCDAIGFPKELIQREPAIGDTEVHDLENRNRFLGDSLAELGLSDLHALDGEYLRGDPRFDRHPELFEPRCSVANRVFRWLGSEVQAYHDGARDDLEIVVTHAEVINLLLAGFGFREPVRQCELLDLSFARSKTRGLVMLDGRFRGQAISKTLVVPSLLFGNQFGW